MYQCKPQHLVFLQAAKRAIAKEKRVAVENARRKERDDQLDLSTTYNTPYFDDSFNCLDDPPPMNVLVMAYSYYFFLL